MVRKHKLSEVSNRLMYSLFLELLHIYRLMCLILAAVENIHSAQPSSISLLELTKEGKS